MKPVVKILGERSCGTNLLASVLAANFDVDLAASSTGLSRAQQAALPGRIPRGWSSRRASKEAIQDHNHNVELPENGGWKHAAATPRLLEEFVRPRDCTVLCLVRHPADWARSMHRNPFHGIGRIPRSFAEFLHTPWIAAARDELGERLLDHPIRLLERKVASYDWLSRAWSKTHVLRYEDLVQDPDQALSPAGLLRHQTTDRISLPTASARGFGKGNLGLAAYRDKAIAASYASLAPADRDWVLSEISGSALLDLYPA